MMPNFDELLTRLSERDPREVALVLVIFLSVFLSLWLVARWIESRQAVRRRAVAYNPSSGRLTTSNEDTTDTRQDAAYDLLYLVEKGFTDPTGDRHSKIRAELMRAGWFGRHAVTKFYAARLVLAIVFGIVATFLVIRFLPEADVLQRLAMIGGGVAVGALIPQLVLQSRQRETQRSCELGFPDFLDLLVICAEGGLPPRAGIERVSRELVRTHPYLGANLFLMHLQLRAGRTLSETLTSMSNRVHLDEARSLGALLQQSEELGTNVSTTLRTFSEDMRSRRMLKAEEKAHALPVKLVIPLAIFIFPVMLIVIFLPLITRLSEAFG
ncbi:MAG: type II secretion system F family protein [Pseudomonadota bacterium]